MNGIKLFEAMYSPDQVRTDDTCGRPVLVAHIHDVVCNHLSNIDLEGYDIHVVIEKVPIDVEGE